MDALLRAVREFFASPVLLSTSGASATATSSPSTSVSPPRRGPAATSRGDAAASSAALVVSSGGSVEVPTPVARALRFVVSLLRRHYKSVLAVACLIALAHVARILIMQRKRLRQQKSRSVAESNLHSRRVEVVQRQHHTLVDRKHGNVSRQSCAISDVSVVGEHRSSSSSPQPLHPVPVVKDGTSPSLFTQDGPIVESEYYPQSLVRDDDGRMYVIHRHGEYIEVWEADEYGQVKDASANYGDPDEHCVELLSHFKREASISMKADAQAAAEELQQQAEGDA
ncbi:membrane-associated protein, putative [Bodo saltans]|uniref:Membrane-associated protein, putative n=1 Tax=Bodo saltans TaxID=75058 RepID=A0A0S4JSF6_BODSA|nr:membrane-associated protein, putative [Bodo saltans]|eukprot:CUG94437.1 membrane-associated protein, putative [Bodo saltans]